MQGSIAKKIIVLVSVLELDLVFNSLVSVLVLVSVFVFVLVLVLVSESVLVLVFVLVLVLVLVWNYEIPKVGNTSIPMSIDLVLIPNGSVNCRRTMILVCTIEVKMFDNSKTKEREKKA
jgi:hypothetical protein